MLCRVVLFIIVISDVLLVMNWFELGSVFNLKILRTLIKADQLLTVGEDVGELRVDLNKICLLVGMFELHLC